MKDNIKIFLLQKLHAIDRQNYDLANALATTGIKNYLELDYDNLKKDILAYVRKMEVSPFAYKYSASRNVTCLYASVYAVMLQGLFGELENLSEERKKDWADYINSFQSPDDGLYYDPALAGDAFEHIGLWNEGWGKHHLMGHVIIALARLGHRPKYRLKYLEKYYDTEYLSRWMDSFDFSEDVWTASNYFMNLFTVLEYARDYMDEKRAETSIDMMIEWLLSRQNPDTGMWHGTELSKLDHLGKLKVVRAAYHFYPLFEYEGFEIPYAGQIVDTILPLQNSWGGWTVENGNSGACEDIDAIEPLIRCAVAKPERKAEINQAIQRSMVWQLACRNEDGGFSFYLKAQQEYGNHPVTTSLRDESSMFATWFRTLCISYEMKYLNMPNNFNIGRFPGYEISF